MKNTVKSIMWSKEANKVKNKCYKPMVQPAMLYDILLDNNKRVHTHTHKYVYIKMDVRYNL